METGVDSQNYGKKVSEKVMKCFMKTPHLQLIYILY